MRTWSGGLRVRTWCRRPSHEDLVPEAWQPVKTAATTGGASARLVAAGGWASRVAMLLQLIMQQQTMH
eukprot:363354-Chlamydomonas_euryale.AAC.9